MSVFDIKQVKHIKEFNEEQIKELQKILKELGHDPGDIDGKYGQKTLYAYKKFKGKYGLLFDELWGETTADFIKEKLDDTLDETEKEESSPQQKETKSGYTVTNINWFDYDCPVSKYFTVGEVSKYSKERIVYNESHRNNVIEIAKLLDWVREQWGSGIGVTSWYRPVNVNSRVGGARNSQHLTGSGVDIYPIGKDIHNFQSWLDKRWNRALGWGARKGFVHIDLRSAPPRIRWPY